MTSLVETVEQFFADNMGEYEKKDLAPNKRALLTTTLSQAKCRLTLDVNTTDQMIVCHCSPVKIVDEGEWEKVLCPPEQSKSLTCMFIDANYEIGGGEWRFDRGTGWFGYNEIIPTPNGKISEDDLGEAVTHIIDFVVGSMSTIEAIMSGEMSAEGAVPKLLHELNVASIEDSEPS